MVKASGVCANGGAHQRDPSKPLFKVPGWLDRWAFGYCTTCHTVVRYDDRRTYRCGTGFEHTVRDFFMFRMVDAPTLSSQDVLAFPCCDKCGGLYDPQVSPDECPAGGRPEQAPAVGKPRLYEATRNRWTLPCCSFVICATCGRLHPEHTDPTAKTACLQKGPHSDRNAGRAYFFG